MKKEIDYKIFKITWDSVIYRFNSIEYKISTKEIAKWGNGVFGAKTSFAFTKDTIIKTAASNKYVCEYEQLKSIMAADVLVKPIIVKNGDSFMVSNVSSHFELCRDNQFFSVGLSSINTTLDGNKKD
jgi:hypothetical protein